MEDSGTSLSSTPNDTIAKEYNIPAALKFVISNIKIIVSTQLTSENYAVWRSQILKLLTTNGFSEFLEQSASPPTRFVDLPEGRQEINPKYREWVLVDQNLAAAICSTISPAILPYVINLDSTSMIWVTIERRLQSSNRSRVIQLRNELHNIRMNNQSMIQYLTQIKSIADNLSAAGMNLDQEDITLYTLNGLPSSYNAFKMSIRTMLHPIDLDNLYSLLISEEINIQADSLRNTTLQESSTALYTYRGRGKRTRGRNSSQTSRTSSGQLVQCQICNKKGHTANNCWHQSNLTVNPPETQNTSSRAMIAPTEQENQDWYLDSGASAHLTHSLDNVSQAISYNGNDNITIGDGRNIPIAHSGKGILPTPSSKLKLQSLFHVPNLSYNLLSIFQLTKDNNVSVYFDTNGFIIKDLKTNHTILSGPSRKGLYPISTIKSSMNKKALAAVSNPTSWWHQRLGHTNYQTLRLVSNTNKSLNILKNVSVCEHCIASKGHKLIFSHTASRSLTPLQLIHTDVWGPSPVSSHQGFLYYVAFIDDFSKFTWVFPIHNKSDVFFQFVQFKTQVEKQTNYQIKCLRSDGGKEYLNSTFANFLNQHGIQHQTSCPYTPEQNGSAERKHRHLIEMTRTLLHTASMPYTFWPDAVLTASYIINRLPSIHNNLSSPLQLLYNKQPNYTFLKIFGCACFSWIPPVQRHKLEPRSRQCVFLGYSSISKGYKCLDLNTNKIVVSRHVIFDESKFPFQHSAPQFTIPEQMPSNPSMLVPTHGAAPPQTPKISQEAVNLPPNTSDRTGNTPRETMQFSDLPVTIPNLSKHPMTTRLQSGKLKPIQRLNLLHMQESNTTDTMSDPTTYQEASKHSHWRAAMADEFYALQRQGTWDLVPLPPNTSLLGSKWTFRTKYNSDGTVARFKARLVAQGNTQQYGVNYLETFSPVAKFTTIRTFLTIAIHYNWPVHQIDITNAFLHGKLNETIFMKHPKGFEDDTQPNYVCKLKKTIYGLKQSPRMWFQMLSTHLQSIGFVAGKADSSMFLFSKDDVQLFMVIYVDDILLTGNNNKMITSTINQLKTKFDMKHLGLAHSFLGIQITRTNNSFFLSQSQYANSILDIAGMSQCKPLANPSYTKPPVPQAQEFLGNDPKLYRHLVGSLQYLTLTRPDISFAVNSLCQHMHNPMSLDFLFLHRLLRYIKGTLTYGLPITQGDLVLQSFSDADWAGDKDTRRSTTGYCTFLGHTLVSWSVKKQHTVARSSTEAEYKAIATALTDIIWLRRLLLNFNISLTRPTTLYCDSTSAIALANNPVFHAHTKHIEIDHYFIRDHINSKTVNIFPISKKDQVADIFTKQLSTSRYQLLRDKLTVHQTP
ncbi:Retrovirus-related Pol polyprotein from transposon TNT 1-94 [Dendrobium catenatum]|uniref:Retrovirus-related Pol polyprotein from transposon TNT 1-94 n=1 Tax=Dendrobium catenatum TaxID=906689 RepID=A0A2I0W3C5_9ASPA|nr:Retrovirus-related Pol polyprotein from transposon TNT 1-94 [Dendrobium catenatum]